jgi:hypothetical protein
MSFFFFDEVHRDELNLSKNFSISGIFSLIYHLQADPPLSVFSCIHKKGNGKVIIDSQSKVRSKLTLV